MTHRRPVALTDLAAQLGVSTRALRFQVGAGRLPAYKVSEDASNAPWVVDADVADEVRKWHAANPRKNWPTFPLEEERAATEEAPDGP